MRLAMGEKISGTIRSYMSHVTKDVCSAALMIYWKVTKQRYKGSMVVKSKDTDNYCAEILGGVVVQLQLIPQEASHWCTSPYCETQVECNNVGVVSHGDTPRRGLKEKQAQMDVLRCLKQIIMENSFITTYLWVAKHQDDIKNWEDLTLNIHLKVTVDCLARRAHISSVVEQEFISSKFLLEHLWGGIRWYEGDWLATDIF